MRVVNGGGRRRRDLKLELAELSDDACFQTLSSIHHSEIRTDFNDHFAHDFDRSWLNCIE